jgi:uncharacterized protein
LVAVTNKAKDNENRFGFSLFAADQDIKVAKWMGLFWEDQVPFTGAGEEYGYTIKITKGGDLNTFRNGFAIQKTEEETPLPPPTGLQFTGQNKSVLLEWDMKKDVFSSYHVERAPENTANWMDLNKEKPVLFTNSGPNNENKAIYIDSLGNNTQKYQYRVTGRNIFGVVSEASAVVLAQGKPDPIMFNFQILQPVETQNKVTLSWAFPPTEEINIIGFDVWRASQMDDKLTKINTSLLPPKARSFEDKNPLPANYYVIKTTDINGYEYQTIQRLGQPVDNTPPAKATNLAGECDPQGVVTLHWKRSPSGDVMGYRVFMSNSGDGDFAQVSTVWINDTIFRCRVDFKTLTEFAWYGIKAIDFRENRSPMSDLVKIKRPDITPPLRPIISNVQALATGVSLEWKLSVSTDVVKHTLQRKRIGIPGWKTLVVITPNSPIYTFLDNTALARKWYQYRLVAEDGAKLRGSSRIVKAKPLDNGLRAPILGFAGTFSPQPKLVNLQWKYEDDPDLIGFEIFRAIEDSTRMRSFKFIAVPPLPPSSNSLSSGVGYLSNGQWNMSYTDIELDFNLKQLNQFYGLATGSNSTATPNQSVPPTVGSTYTLPTPNNMNGKPTTQPGKIYYWIMAKYIDGAYSPLAGSLIISL